LKKTFPNSVRRPKAHLSPYLINYIEERNPWTVVWWSAAFPGAGHLLLCKYVSGILLMFWELVINVKAHINEAIYYSMIGQFELAKMTIDTRWFLLYSAVFVFAMWDCYSTTIDLNKYSQLADRLDSPIKPFKIGAYELHFLDYRKPVYGAWWSFLYPGLGSIYSNRLPTGFFIFICFIATVYYSNVLPAVHLTLTGKTELAGSVIHIQWFLNLPSIVLYSISSSYQDIILTNKLFKVEQSRYLQEHYQPGHFIMPQKIKKRDYMHIISTFRHSALLELALNDLEQQGIPKDNIFVTSLEKFTPKIRNVHKIHQDDASKMELSFFFGAIFMLLGGIYGFIWTWGPIIWSLIGLIFGVLLGIIFSLFIYKSKWFKKEPQTEVVLIVECESNQSEIVEGILWGHNALGVSKTS